MQNTFFKTKAGKMTVAFIVVMLAFSSIMFGIASNNGLFIEFGFALMLAAMLYSPIDVFILNRKKK